MDTSATVSQACATDPNIILLQNCSTTVEMRGILKRKLAIVPQLLA